MPQKLTATCLQNEELSFLQAITLLPHRKNNSELSKSWQDQLKLDKLETSTAQSV